MEGSRYDLSEALDHIDPSVLDYQGWVNVGMALKHEGYGVDAWDAFSRRDPARYHAGECRRKWGSFHEGACAPVTGGTIVQMARDQGWEPPCDPGHALGWEDSFTAGGAGRSGRPAGGGRGTDAPGEGWDPVNDLITYLETLFDSTDFVGYVTKSFEKDGKHTPTKGSCVRTAGKLIEQLSKCGGDIGGVLGDYNPQAGAWIRFNPLDGKGCRNENVADFRYALVESDSLEIERQDALIRELELPVACLVHSGKRSLHAIVRIDAASYGEYRKRVDYLYDVCRKNGLEIDRQNKNPSRLSRMPGVMRGGQKQFLVGTGIGKGSFREWKEWIESVSDDLPEPESLGDVWGSLPALAPPLIDGVLRQGHKMLVAGPSKAGKSFALIELCIAIAEGREWLSWQCAKGRVMYVNLELDRPSCLHRFRDVYQAMGIRPESLGNIDIWNLRGKARPMDKLAPMLIRRAAKKEYMAIVIDPIYKVITGDENSADQMANFCNQFDLVCNELGVAVIYCHHHSKGSQGGKKSMDRASGSGVFARDPDAMLDMIGLGLSEDVLKQEENKAVCAACTQYLDAHFRWQDDLSQDDLCSSRQMLNYCENRLDKRQWEALSRNVEAARAKARGMTAWRIEGTLREFPRFAPVDLWFDYPAHKVDRTGVLGDIQPDAEAPSWKRNFGKKKSHEEAKKERMESLEEQFEALRSFDEDGEVTLKGLAESMGTTEKTVRNRIKEHGGFWIGDGKVGRK